MDGHSKGKCIYKTNPGSILIRKYNKLAKAMRIKARIEQTENLSRIPKNALLENGVFVNRIVRELIRIYNVRQHKRDYLQYKFLKH